MQWVTAPGSHRAGHSFWLLCLPPFSLRGACPPHTLHTLGCFWAAPKSPREGLGAHLCHASDRSGQTPLPTPLAAAAPGWLQAGRIPPIPRTRGWWFYLFIFIFFWGGGVLFPTGPPTPTAEGCPPACPSHACPRPLTCREEEEEGEEEAAAAAHGPGGAGSRGGREGSRAGGGGMEKAPPALLPAPLPARSSPGSAAAPAGTGTGPGTGTGIGLGLGLGPGLGLGLGPAHPRPGAARGARFISPLLKGFSGSAPSPLASSAVVLMFLGSGKSSFLLRQAGGSDADFSQAGSEDRAGFRTQRGESRQKGKRASRGQRTKQERVC